MILCVGKKNSRAFDAKLRFALFASHKKKTFLAFLKKDQVRYS